MTPGAYVFGYGSLVSCESLAATLGHEIAPDAGPFPAALAGWRRSWNVGSDRRSHPERTMVEPSGRRFTGVMAVLGISPAEGSQCNGAAFRVSAQDLRVLADRERNYAQRDVTAAIRWPAKPAAAQILTFAPTPAALDRLVAAREEAVAVVRRGYIELVEEGFEKLGAGELDRFRTSTIPHSLEVSELLRAPQG